jgi:hypothetical protein
VAHQDEDFALWLINFDPTQPSAALATSATEAMLAAQQMIRAADVPWPASLAPVPDPINPAPSETAALPRRDVLFVTWTAGEAATMAQLLTGDNFQDWHQYRRHVDAYIPKVTGFAAKKFEAPFRGPVARYRHSLGLYFPFRIGALTGLAFKSGLHMAYDGPAVPLTDLWKQIIAEVRPKLVVTTGTGGGIGADVLLGDVIVARAVKFDLTTVLKDKSFAHKSFPAAAVDDASMKKLITKALLKPNGILLEHPRVPKIFLPSDPHADIVSTDAFAFDESTNHFKLQGLGRCCDMGDATLGLAFDGESTAPALYAIRNASDPQIPNPDNDLNAARREAHRIYGTYQCVTTAGSVIASWALALSKLGTTADVEKSLAVEMAPPVSRPKPKATAEATLLALASADGFSKQSVNPADVSSQSLDALKQRLAEENVDYASSTVAISEIRYADSRGEKRVLYFADVTSVDAEEFLGVYVISGADIVAKFESASS